MAEARLETGRLVLREPQGSDLAWQLEWLNTPAVQRHLGGGPQTVDHVARSFANNAAGWEQGEPAFWTVALRENDQPVGKCGFSRITAEAAPVAIRGVVQVGWTLAEPFWGQGLASEAARAAIGYGFEVFDLAEIWAQTSDSNIASTRLMARLGLIRCPDLCYRDDDYPPANNPAIVYLLGRDEWAART